VPNQTPVASNRLGGLGGFDHRRETACTWRLRLSPQMLEYHDEPDWRMPIHACLLYSLRMGNKTRTGNLNCYQFQSCRHHYSTLPRPARRRALCEIGDNQEYFNSY
jgi:hypothetical protein